MISQDEFSNRIIYLRKIHGNFPIRELSQIHKSAPNSEIDLVVENGNAIFVLIFESEEDCLSWKLKHGGKYD